MIELRPFKAEDILKIAVRGTEKIFFAGIKNLLKQGEFQEKAGPAFSAFENGKILGAAGVGILWPGVGEAWVCASEEVVAKTLWFHKTIKRTLYNIIEYLNLHRVQTAVEVNFEIGKKWAERLGFKYESTMPSYGPNKETYLRYVIIKEN